MARRKSALLLVADCFTSVFPPASNTSIWSWSLRLFTRPSASVRAFSNRDGSSSVLCIEAEASRITTRKSLVVVCPEK